MKDRMLKKPIGFFQTLLSAVLDVWVVTRKSLLNASKIPAKLLNELTPLAVGVSTFLVYALELHQIKQALQKTIRKPTARYRSMKLITNSIILSLLCAGLGGAFVYGLTAFGITFAGATFLPIALPVVLAVTYGLGLFRESKALHNLKKEKAEAEKNYNDAKHKLEQIKQEEKNKLIELWEVVLCELSFLQNQLTTKLLNAKNQEVGALQLEIKKIMNQKKQIVDWLETQNNKNPTKKEKLAQILNTIKLSKSVKEKLNEIKSISNQRQSIEVALNEKEKLNNRLEHKVFKAERAVAYKSVEVFATVLGIVGVAIGFIVGTSLGLVPLGIIMAAVIIGLGVKAFEKMNSENKFSYTYSIRNRFTSLFKKKPLQHEIVNELVNAPPKEKTNNAKIYKDIRNKNIVGDQAPSNDDKFNQKKKPEFEPHYDVAYEDNPYLDLETSQSHFSNHRTYKTHSRG